MGFPSLFLTLDFFGIPPVLNINGKKYFNTFCGTCISIFIILIAFFFIIFYSLIILKHSQPNILTTIYNDENPKLINLKPENFVITFSLQNIEYENYIDESIYTINATKSIVYLDDRGINNAKETEISVIKCSDYKFQIIPQYFKSLPLKNLYCINETDIRLQGQFKQNVWEYVNVRFSKCINSTNNNFSCKSETEINNALKGGFIGIFLTDFNILPNNYSHPYHIYGKNIYNTFSINYHLSYWIFLKSIELKTDSGLIFSNIKSMKFFALEDTKPDIDYREGNVFLTMVFRNSPKREVYERTYLKIQDVAATISGIINLSLIIGEILVYIIRLTLYRFYFIQFFNPDNKIFNYKRNDKNIISSKNRNSFILKKTKLLKDNYLEKFNSVVKSPNISNIDKLNKIKNISQENVNNKKNSYVITEKKNNTSILLSSFNNKTIKQISNIKLKNLINKKYHSKNNFLDISNEFKKIYKEDIDSSKGIIMEEEFSKKSDNILKSKTSSVSKIELSQVKSLKFCLKLICQKNCVNKIINIHKKYKIINYVFDLIYFVKIINDLNVIKQILFNFEQRIYFADNYLFDSDFICEKIGYERKGKNINNMIYLS
jgi:hypothetical protein